MHGTCVCSGYVKLWLLAYSFCVSVFHVCLHILRVYEKTRPQNCIFVLQDSYIVAHSPAYIFQLWYQICFSFKANHTNLNAGGQISLSCYK